MTNNIVKAKISDIEIIVNMHMKCISDSFFSYLGEKFLRIIYSKLVSSKYASTYLYIENNQVVGYISFVLNKKLIFIEILFSKCFTILFSLRFKPFFKCIFYCFNSIEYIIKKQYCKSEFLFIAVEPAFRNNNIASALITFAENILKQKNIYKIQVSVSDSNYISQNLLKNKNYIFYRIINFYGKKMYMYYKLL